ncbi:MAG: hypothetical protein D4S01_01390 [Dehalococcoidia bacterium]|nr:MAG: hypothetical protein D4S01_01390 [Dehalococcoidia bacterium]
MKQVMDRTRSTRPINVPDEEDVKKMENARAKATEELAEIEDSIMRLESPDYQKLVEESKQDMIEIALAAMELEADDVKGFSRAQGQFFERKRLTQKLTHVRIEAEEKKNFISVIADQTMKLVKKMQKTKEGKKDGR